MPNHIPTSLSVAVLLMMVAFRAEVVIAEWLEKASLKLEWLSNNDTTLKRGSTPTVVEWLILGWVVGKSVDISSVLPAFKVR